MRAARHGHVAALEAMLAASCNMNSPRKVGLVNAALCCAARRGQTHACAALLRHGAFIDVTDDAKGQTPLMHACIWRRVHTALFLLSAGADAVHLADATGRTALMRAVSKGLFEVVHAMLSKRSGGFDVDAARTRDGGLTPLMLAAYHGHAAIAKLLLDAGARHEAATTAYPSPDDAKWTPVNIEANRGHWGTVRVLFDAGSPQPDPKTVQKQQQIGCFSGALLARMMRWM